MEDPPKPPKASALVPSRKSGRQDWDLQPSDGASTPAELYLKTADDSSDDGGDGEDTYAALQIGDELPHFQAASTNERAPVDSRVYAENQWLVLVTFCRTYDPVATSELTALAEMGKEFEERRVKILGLAVNTKTTIEKWVTATEELNDIRISFPVVADSDAVIAATLGLIRHSSQPDPRALVHGTTCLIINPNNRIEVIQHYPESCGRNFHEVLRAVDALNMAYLHPHVSCGGNWASGEDVFITNDVEPMRAKSLFPRGFVEIRPWFRLAPPPNLEILDAALDAFSEADSKSMLASTQPSTLESRSTLEERR